MNIVPITTLRSRNRILPVPPGSTPPQAISPFSSLNQRLVLPGFEFYINRIIQYVSFCLWFRLLHIMYIRSMLSPVAQHLLHNIPFCALSCFSLPLMNTWVVSSSLLSQVILQERSCTLLFLHAFLGNYISRSIWVIRNIYIRIQITTAFTKIYLYLYIPKHLKSVELFLYSLKHQAFITTTV